MQHYSTMKTLTWLIVLYKPNLGTSFSASLAATYPRGFRVVNYAYVCNKLKQVVDTSDRKSVTQFGQKLQNCRTHIQCYRIT